jgi:hypothetical protein
MSGAATIRNAYIAQGFASLGLLVFAIIYIFADDGPVFVFQVPALAAAFVMCIWSLTLSVRSVAITGKWQPALLVWILVAFELNVPAAYTWKLLSNYNNGIQMWTTIFCAIALPVIAPVLTIAGVLLILAVRRRSRIIDVIAVITFGTVFFLVAPLALYIMSSVTITQQPKNAAAWHRLVVEVFPNRMKTCADQLCTNESHRMTEKWSNPIRRAWRISLCRDGMLPASHLIDNITHDDLYLRQLSFDCLRIKDKQEALNFSLDVGLGNEHVPEDSPSDALTSSIGYFLAREGDEIQLHNLLKHFDRCPLKFKAPFLIAIANRSTGIKILEYEVIRMKQRDQACIGALADALEKSGVKGAIYRQWSALRSSTDDLTRIAPLYFLKEKCEDKIPFIRRAAMLALSDSLSVDLNNTPLPDESAAEAKPELDEAAAMRVRICKLFPGPKLLEALKSDGDVPLIAWKWLVEQYPKQAIGVAEQIGHGSVRFKPQLDAEAAEYLGRKGTPEQIRALLVDPKQMTYAFLTNMLKGIGAGHRREFISDLKQLARTADYLRDDVAMPLYQLFDTEEATREFRLLLEGDTEQRQRAARGFPYIEDAALRLQIATQLSEHPDLRIRRMAWGNLGGAVRVEDLKTPANREWVEFLLELLKNGDVSARRASVHALAALFSVKLNATRDARDGRAWNDIDFEKPLLEQPGEHDELESVRLKARQWLEKYDAETEKPLR